jgi:conjugative transposon TraJ protein
MRNALELAYQSAALVINTIRTFFLIILSIIGPISFGFAIWPGFEGTLTNWFSRYINVFLWLPVANIFGAIIAKIQVMMLNIDINQIQTGGDLESADMAYMIFLVIAIAGYFTVPSVASWIVSASGLTNITRYATTQGGNVANLAGAAAGGAGGQLVGRAMDAGRQLLGGGGQQSGGGQGGNGYQNTNKAA